MIKQSLSWIAQQVDGQLSGTDLDVQAVTIDSRQVPASALFVAIEGERFDGHDYAEQAVAAGAVAVMTTRRLPLQVAQIIVSDTRIALGLLAAAVKAVVAPQTVALTGSSGKTTVKEMCAAILRQRGKVLATKGNFNNDIGVPLTLLALEGDEQFAVIELGANHRGEIAYTSNLVRPDVALINNISAAHVEGFGDLQGVAKAKAEIVTGLKADGVIYTNGDCPFADFWHTQYASRDHRQFAVNNTRANVRAEQISTDSNGCAAFTLCIDNQRQLVQIPLPGNHNVYNALAAAALTSAVGASVADIAAGIATLKPVPGRMHVRQSAGGLRLIDDTYNANVGSVKAAIDALAVYPGQRVLVLGDLGELGAQAGEYHTEIGTYAKAAGIDQLFTLGTLSKHANQGFSGHDGHHFDNQEALLSALQDWMKQATDRTILIKGSRSARMERIVEAIEQLEQARCISGTKGEAGASTC